MEGGYLDIVGVVELVEVVEVPPVSLNHCT